MTDCYTNLMNSFWWIGGWFPKNAKVQWKLDLAELDLAKKLDLANNLGTPEFLLSKIHSI